MAIDLEAKKQGIIQDILLEVNIADEESKGGFSADEILEISEKISSLQNQVKLSLS